jgi:glutamyl/glutaminyl-tRNA synthetase
LGFVPDEPPIGSFRTGERSAWRQSDNGPAYEAAVAELDRRGLVYACTCSRLTFTAWAADHGGPWSGPGCPGDCAGRGRVRGARGVGWRVALGGDEVVWTDLILGPLTGSPAAAGDLPIRDRHGNWTYALCVVVDDLRHGIELVIRGQDLLHATPAQIRLASLLGRPTPPHFLHHPLIHRPDGRKLSKADGATGLRQLVRDGTTPAVLRRRAAAAIGLE